MIYPIKKVLEISPKKKKKSTIFVGILVMCKSCGLRICCCISSAKNINITMGKFEKYRYWEWLKKEYLNGNEKKYIYSL